MRCHHGKTTVSYMRRSPLGENVYRLEQDITPKWRLRAEYFSGSDTTEIGVRYRIHEFLSAEYVYSMINHTSGLLEICDKG